MTIPLVVVALWVATGTIIGVIDARHGAWSWAWIVDALLGPFALPQAVQRRRLLAPPPVVLARGQPGAGPIDVLVGIDGSASSVAAARFATGLLGARVRRVTLAAVLDVDTAAPHADSVLNPEPWPEEAAARERLASAVAAVRSATGEDAGSVVLAGDPADALERYALDEGFGVIVIGCRGRGLTKLMLGSCASKLASRTAVPVLLVPGTSAGGSGGMTAEIASPTVP